MSTICGANCEKCSFRESCKGCEATCGSPFGGRCVAAEYIKTHGRETYAAYKAALLGEVNGLLKAQGIPAEAAALYELPGSYLNLAYPLPGGETAKFLADRDIYLACQLEVEGAGHCYGAVTDGTFVLLCSYGAEGSDPALIAFRKLP